MSLITRLAFCGVASFSISIGSHADDPVQVLHSWGSNSYGLKNIPAELEAAMQESRIVQLTDSGSSEHVGAVLQDGRIFMWGLNNFGQCDPPDDIGTLNDPVLKLATGQSHTVALMQDGRVECWGNQENRRCDTPVDYLATAAPVLEVCAGRELSACLLEGGILVAWGSDTFSLPDWDTVIPLGVVLDLPGFFNENQGPSTPATSVVSIAGGDRVFIIGFDTGVVFGLGLSYWTSNQIDQLFGAQVAIKLSGGEYQGASLGSNGDSKRWGYQTDNNRDPSTGFPYTAMAGAQFGQQGYNIYARADGPLLFEGYYSSDLADFEETGPVRFLNDGFVGGDSVILGCAPQTGFAAGIPYVQNTTTGRFAPNLPDALVEAVDGDEIYAIPSLFTGSALDFYDRPVLVESRGVVDLPTTETWTLGGSARLGAYEDIRISGGLQVAANAAISLRPDRGGEVQHAIVVEDGGRFSLNNNSATEVIATTDVRVDGQLNLSTDSVLFNDIGGGIEVGSDGELMAIDANLRVASLDVLADSAGRGSAFCLGSTFDVEQTSIAGGILNVLGGTVIGDVAVDAGSEADGTLNASGTIFGDLDVIDGRATSLDDLVIVGDLFNRVDGVVAVQVGTLFVTGGIANEGQIYGEVVGAPGFMGGGSTSQGDGLAIAGDLTLGPDASIRFSEPLWQISLGGDFDVAITSPSQFELIGSTLRLDGSSGETQHFEATSLDIGPDPLAFTDPPAGVSLIRELEIVSQTGVTVVDQHLNGGGKSNAREAIYASRLEVAEGASLVLGEHILYCTEADIDGAVDHPDQIVVVSILPDPDFNDDGLVNGADLAFILAFWGTNDPDVDLNGDGMVTAADLGILLGAWGVYP